MFSFYLQMGLVGQLASLRIERGTGYTEEQLDDRNRQVEWERGQIDYMGIDSFSNIQVLREKNCHELFFFLINFVQNNFF